MLYIRLYLLALLIITTPVQARTDKSVDLFELSIQELSKLKVFVASKREEPIQDAPSVINVITKEDIRNYGGNTLADLLRRLPSVYDATGSGAPNTNFNVRGQSSSNLNKHILILLNGRPIHDATFAGWNHAIYQGFPLEAIEKIEFIRGPGSVLYGSGAFSAVIDIKTKMPVDGFQGSVALKGGSMETRSLELSGGLKKGDLTLYGAGRMGDSDFAKGFSDRAGTFSTQPLKQDNYSGVIQLTYKDFELNVFHAREDSDSPNFPFVFPLLDKLNERSLIDVGYKFNFNNNWKAMINATYSETTNTSSVNTQKGRTILTEGNVSGILFDKLNVLIGVTNENHLYIDNSNSGKKLERGFYSQLDYKPWHWVKVLGGVQLNDPGSGNFDPSFRAGFIVNFNESWGTKLLYSEAFRSPSLGETTNFLAGSINRATNLMPEEIATYDVQLFYNSTKLDAALTFFHSKQTKSIRFLSDPDDPGRFKFQNSGVSYYKGFELEGSYRYNKLWSFEGSISYQFNEQNSVEDSQLVPNWQGKFGAVYNNQRGLRLGLFHTYTSDPTNAEEITATTPVVNPSGSPHHYLSANLDLTLNKYFDFLKSFPNTIFSVYGSDLLESGNFFTPDINKSVNTFPIGPGRSVFATLKVDF
jgi:outer membrane receptor protein involved in Fe transport